jgi:hypothetical protein
MPERVDDPTHAPAMFIADRGNLLRTGLNCLLDH